MPRTKGIPNKPDVTLELFPKFKEQTETLRVAKKVLKLVAHLNQEQLIHIAQLISFPPPLQPYPATYSVKTEGSTATGSTLE
jgi:hypothetical protein